MAAIPHPSSFPLHQTCNLKSSILFPHYRFTLLKTSCSPTTPQISCDNQQITNIQNQPTLLALLQELQLDLNQILHSHPELQLEPPESICNRLLSLQALGITSSTLQRVLLDCPQILTSAEFQEFLDFVQQELSGFAPAKLGKLLLLARPELFAGIVARARLLVDHGLPAEKLGHVFNNVDIRKVFCELPVKELEEKIEFLKGYGWPELILRRPIILNLDLHSQLIPRIEFLVELCGGDVAAAALLIRKRPAHLSYSVENVRSHLEFWKSVGLTTEQVYRITLVYPSIFTISKERKLMPRVEFLRRCGFTDEGVFKFLVKAPLFLSLAFKGNLANKLALLVKIGHRPWTRELALAMGSSTRTNCRNMQMVLGLYFSYGLSCEDVLSKSIKHPQVLQYNHDSLEKKMEFLIEEMERDVEEILVFPAFLGYKLDERIKKRYAIKKELKGKGMSINKLLSVSSETFYSNKTFADMEALV